MPVITTTHLDFRGQARLALDHYAAVFGGQVMALTFAQGGNEQDAADGAVAEQLEIRRGGSRAQPASDPPKICHANADLATRLSTR